MPAQRTKALTLDSESHQLQKGLPNILCSWSVNPGRRCKSLLQPINIPKQQQIICNTNRANFSLIGEFHTQKAGWPFQEQSPSDHLRTKGA